MKKPIWVCLSWIDVLWFRAASAVCDLGQKFNEQVYTMYVCMYVYDVSMYVCMYIYVDIRIYIHVCMCIYTCTYWHQFSRTTICVPFPLYRLHTILVSDSFTHTHTDGSACSACLPACSRPNSSQNRSLFTYYPAPADRNCYLSLSSICATRCYGQLLLYQLELGLFSSPLFVWIVTIRLLACIIIIIIIMSPSFVVFCSGDLRDHSLVCSLYATIVVLRICSKSLICLVQQLFPFATWLLFPCCFSNYSHLLACPKVVGHIPHPNKHCLVVPNPLVCALAWCH